MQLSGRCEAAYLAPGQESCLPRSGQGSCAESPHQTSTSLEMTLLRRGRPIPVSSVTGFTLVRSSSRCSGASWPRNSCRSSLRASPPWASRPELWPLTWEGITGPGELGLRPAGSYVGVEACTVERELASSIIVWLGSNFSSATC